MCLLLNFNYPTSLEVSKNGLSAFSRRWAAFIRRFLERGRGRRPNRIFGRADRFKTAVDDNRNFYIDVRYLWFRTLGSENVGIFGHARISRNVLCIPTERRQFGRRAVKGLEIVGYCWAKPVVLGQPRERAGQMLNKKDPAMCKIWRREALGRDTDAPGYSDKLLISVLLEKDIQPAIRAKGRQVAQSPGTVYNSTLLLARLVIIQSWY